MKSMAGMAQSRFSVPPPILTHRAQPGCPGMANGTAKSFARPCACTALFTSHNSRKDSSGARLLSPTSVGVGSSTSCRAAPVIGPCLKLAAAAGKGGRSSQSRDLLLRASGGSGSPGETVDVSFGFPADDEVGENVAPAPPPSEGRIEIYVDKEAIRRLDLSAAHAVLRKFVNQIGDNATAPSADPKELLERTLGFVLNYEIEDPFDPRELSEMPDIRLWFVRLDAAYPWLPVVLDWRGGELARYAAMLVPHQMSKRMGVVYNPEALEIFVMKKVFILHPWLQVIGVSKPQSKLNDMLRMLGFTVTDELYDMIERNPPP